MADRSHSRARGRFPKRKGIPPTVALSVEELEELLLLSAVGPSPEIQANSDVQADAIVFPSPIETPSLIEQAYGFNQITFKSGKTTVVGNGAGQTIAIVDAYNDPNIASDLQTFDTQFGLAAPPSFTVASTAGTPTDSGWAMETALDVEWAHAMAPGANILLVEAASNSLTDLLSAVNYARNQPGVSVVSMSWGASEFSQETAYDSVFTTPAGHTGVTFIASSGDGGAGSSWPAVSPNVLSVGGTSLTLSKGAYSSETGWSGSGGGYSQFETKPSYQSSLQTSKFRSTPDVSYNADPNKGFAVYDSVPISGQSGWWEVGGTSAGAPQWAALVAIADQGRALSGLGSLANAQAAIDALPAVDFHDVKSGSNGAYTAKAGYDLVTGRGSPIANLIVKGLLTAKSQTASFQTHATSQVVIASFSKHNSLGTDPFSADSSVQSDMSTIPSGVSSQIANAGFSAPIANNIDSQSSLSGDTPSSGSDADEFAIAGNLDSFAHVDALSSTDGNVGSNLSGDPVEARSDVVDNLHVESVNSDNHDLVDSLFAGDGSRLTWELLTQPSGGLLDQNAAITDIGDWGRAAAPENATEPNTAPAMAGGALGILVSLANSWKSRASKFAKRQNRAAL